MMASAAQKLVNIAATMGSAAWAGRLICAIKGFTRKSIRYSQPLQLRRVTRKDTGTTILHIQMKLWPPFLAPA